MGVELLFGMFSTLCTISMIFVKRFELFTHILYLRMCLAFSFLAEVPKFNQVWFRVLERREGPRAVVFAHQ